MVIFDLSWTDKHEYQIAYKPFAKDKDGIDYEHTCPNCGGNRWTYHKRTGTKVLSGGQMKFKCAECGQFFICHSSQITAILGLGKK